MYVLCYLVVIPEQVRSTLYDLYFKLITVNRMSYATGVMPKFLILKSKKTVRVPVKRRRVITNQNTALFTVTDTVHHLRARIQDASQNMSWWYLRMIVFAQKKKTYFLRYHTVFNNISGDADILYIIHTTVIAHDDHVTVKKRNSRSSIHYTYTTTTPLR